MEHPDKIAGACRLLVEADELAKMDAIKSLLMACPNQQIRIIADSEEVCKKIKQSVYSESSKPFYLDAQGTRPQQDTIILIASRNCVAQPEFGLDHAEIVVFWDATALLSELPPFISFVDESFYNSPAANAPMRLDLALLMDPRHPTKIPESAAIIGFMSLSLHEKLKRRVQRLFQGQLVRLGRDGRIEPSLEVHLLEFKHDKRSASSIKKQAGMEIFHIKSACIWCNDQRNRFIAAILEVLQGKTTTLIDRRAQKLLRKLSRNAGGYLNCAVLCDNGIQKERVIQSYNNLVGIRLSFIKNEPDFQVLPAEGLLDLQNCNVLIRVDAGTGPIPGATLSPRLTIVDLVDTRLLGFEGQAEKRINAYRHQGYQLKGITRFPKKKHSKESK